MFGGFLEFNQEPTKKRQQPQPVLTYIRRDGELCKNNSKPNIRRSSSASSSETLSSLVSSNDISFAFELKSKIF